MTPGEDTRNFYRNQGIAYEQERIIKLLEDTLYFDLDIGITDGDTDCQIDLEMLIALIKGEK